MLSMADLLAGFQAPPRNQSSRGGVASDMRHFRHPNLVSLVLAEGLPAAAHAELFQITSGLFLLGGAFLAPRGALSAEICDATEKYHAVQSSTVA